MRKQYLPSPRLVSSVAMLALVAATAGCSTDFTRFNSDLYSSAVPAKSDAANPYPGVDNNTTASVSANRGYGVHEKAPLPVWGVSETVSQSDHAGYQPGAQASNQYPVGQYPAGQSANGVIDNRYSQPARTYATQTAGAVESYDLPKPVIDRKIKPASDQLTTSSVRTNTVSAAKSAIQEPVARVEKSVAAVETKVQQTTTQTAANVQPLTDRRGWTKAGGTYVTLREGETLYNLSKRYGVPVSALMGANDLTSADSVKAGQQMLIPTYVYSSNSSVSAPDDNPQTLAASSGRGSLHEPRNSSAAVPSKRATEQFAALGSSETSKDKIEKRYQPKTHSGPSENDEKIPDYSITTGSVSKDGGKGYTVKSGDSLIGIAKKHGVTVEALSRANKLSGSAIRIGQMLVLPSAEMVKAEANAQGVDPIVTGATSKVEPAKTTLTKPVTTTTQKAEPSEKAAVEEKTASVNAGAGFRWPVRGRIIANFGDSVASGRNDGIDISVPEGTAVKAAENGVVVYAGNELSTFGNLVLVRHENGWVSAYAHNKSIEVQKGATVKRGDVIAVSGRSGNAEMPKLHFELRRNSTPVDPVKHLADG